MSLLASWLASPPLDAAIEIAPEAVSIAVLGGRGQTPVVQGYAVEPMPTGAVVPSLMGANMPDRDAVVRALRSACDSVGVRPRRVALVVPDLVGKVSLVRFDQTPARRDDLDQLIRWQMKKSTPFPVEDACVTYSPGTRGTEGNEFVVVAARREIIREYETVCEEAGIEAGLVDLATFGVVNLFLN
jgi:type IV pilus assembly protein PilM